MLKLSARLGRPSDPATSHGSAYEDLDALQFYVAEVDSKCLEVVQTVLIHDKKFLLVDENFRKCSEALNQAVSASTSAVLLSELTFLVSGGVMLL